MTTLSAAALPQSAVLVFNLNNQRYGVPLATVERVLPMAFVLPVPESHGVVGVLNLHGDVLPVVDPRPRLGLPTPKISVEHRLILVRGTNRFLLWVDDIEEVVSTTAETLASMPNQHTNPLVPRVLRLGDAMVPVLSPAKLEA